jgi:MFS family permease
MLLLAINLLNYLDRQVLAAVELPIRREFGLSKLQTGSLMTAFMVAYMLSAPLFGYLADRWRRWWLIGIGVFVWSLASGGTGLATGFVFLVLMRMLVGVGEGAYGPSAPALISDLFPVEDRGKKLAWFYVAIPVGSALGYVWGGLFAGGGVPHAVAMAPLLGNVLDAALSKASTWHHAFWWTVPPGLIVVFLCFYLKLPGDRVRGGAKKAKAGLGQYASLLRNRSYVWNTLGATCMTFAIGGIAFWMPSYLITSRGQREDVANSLFGVVVVLAGLTATLAGGWTGDWLRDRGFRGSYLLVSGSAMLVGFPLILAILVTPFPYAWGVIFLAVFCLFFNTGPANAALANVTAPQVRATAFAMNILVIHLFGDAVSPAIMGWIADHSNLATAIVLVSFMVILGAVFWLIGSRTLDADTAAAESEAAKDPDAANAAPAAAH